METSETLEMFEGEEVVLGTGLQEVAFTNPTNLQMVLVTSSMNHEYTRQEYEQEESYQRRQELGTRMEHLKTLYFHARKNLALTNPEKLEELEQDLSLQKQVILNEYMI